LRLNSQAASAAPAAISGMMPRYAASSKKMPLVKTLPSAGVPKKCGISSVSRRAGWYDRLVSAT